jgi:peptidoglycan/LPS O-acetylase OafA/YrhL
MSSAQMLLRQERERPIAVGKNRSEFDGLRALAVLSVLCYHVLTAPGTRGPIVASYGIGAHGVDLFFVLSGLCLSWSYDHSALTSGRIISFMRTRFVRVAPSYYIVLAIFGLASLTPFGMPAANTAPESSTDALADFARDILFVPTLTPFHDPVIWSLGFEMRWYILFPILAFVYFRSKAFFFGIAVCAYFLNHQFAIPDAGFLPGFMLGIVAADILKRGKASGAIAPFSALAAIAIVCFEQSNQRSIGDHTDPSWQIASFILAVAVASHAGLRRIFSSRPIVAIGIASYSIYLLHEPILCALMWSHIWPVVSAIFALTISVAFWYFVERPLTTRRTRAFFVMLLSPRGTGARSARLADS